MKRLAYSFLLFLALWPACGFAQGKVMYGILGGVNVANRVQPIITDGEEPPSFYRPGVIAGIEMGYYDWDHFCFSLQIFLDQKGFKTDYVRFTANCIEVPLLAKLPIDFHPWHAYLFAGPTFGFIASATSSFPRQKFLVTSGTFDIGITAGIGTAYSVSERVDFFAQAGYAYSLKGVSGIYISNGYSDPNDYSLLPRDFRVYFGIMFSPV